MAIYTVGIFIYDQIKKRIKKPYLMESSHICKNCGEKLYATYETKETDNDRKGWFGSVPDYQRRHETYFKVKFRNFRCINQTCKQFCMVIDYPKPSLKDLEKAENFYLGTTFKVKPNSVYYDKNKVEHPLNVGVVYFHWNNHRGDQKMDILRSLAPLTKKENSVVFNSLKNFGLRLSFSYDEPKSIIVPIDMIDFGTKPETHPDLVNAISQNKSSDQKLLEMGETKYLTC